MQAHAIANDGCRLVAQSRELILKYLNLAPHDDYGDDYLKDAAILLDHAIEKLISK